MKFWFVTVLSNFLLKAGSDYIQRLTSSMPMHPLPILINNGVPVALCSDDPAVWGSTGLSYDMYQVSPSIYSVSNLGSLLLYFFRFWFPVKRWVF